MNMVHPGLYSSLYQHSWKYNFYSFIYFSGQRTYERHNAFDWVSLSIWRSSQRLLKIPFADAWDKIQEVTRKSIMLKYIY